MSGNGEHLQVVFLIDTRSYNKSSALINNDTIGLTKALSLSALKILQSLVGLGGGGKGGGTDEPPRVRSVRWGYKFFDSLRPCSGYRHRDFHDFNLTNFEKFEDELRNKFKTEENESFSDGHSSKKQLKNTTGLGLKVWSQDFAPADHLAVALCEVAQDFQWQAPDIMSPSRNTRSSLSKGSSNSSSVNKSDKTNLTFLFMACPWNGDDLKEFVKMRSNQITTSDLLEVIVHDDVRTDFLEKHHVKLIWFDTRIVISHKLCKCNQAILKVVQGMMRTINGHLIPLNAILSMGSQVTSSLSTILHSASVKKSKSTRSHSVRKKGQPNLGSKSDDKKCVKKSANIFEHFNTVSNCMTVSSVMDYCCCKAHLTKQNESQASEIITTLYVPKGANLEVFCCLKITSLSANPNFRKITCVEKSSIELNKATSDCINGEERETELIDGINTVIKGSLPRDQIQLHCLNSKFVYSCLGLKPKPMQNETNQKVDDDNYEEQLSNSFSSLMEQLARNNHILVLDVSHSEWLTSLLAIMEPLTSSMASLRLISLKNAPNMQSIKTGIWLNKDTEKCHQRLLKRNEKIEEEIIPNERAMENKAVSFVDLQELVVRQFHPYQLELWYKSAPSCGVNSQYITQLTSRQGANSNNMSSALGKAMMDLRDVYCKDHAVLSKSSLPFPHNNPQATKVTSVVSNQAEQNKKRLTRAKSFGGRSASRTGIILENSKKLQKNKSNELVSKEEEGKKELPAQKDKATVNINEILAEFSSSEDLLNHLKNSYGNQLQQDSCPCLFAQTVVSIAKHFVKVQQNEKDNIEETKTLLKNCLVMSNKQLREKYQREDHQASVEERIREVILQVVLQLEMEALSPTDILSSKCGEGFKKEGVVNTNDDDVSSDGEEKENELPSCLQNIVDEMVAMLQTIPFLADHNTLTMFLQEKLLPNYADTVPYMLVGIYEGLMQPLPSKLCSPSTEDLTSVQQPPSSSFGSVSSMEAAGSIPSNRPRGLKRLPSLANIQTRTITVDLKKNENKPKESGGMRVKKKPVVEEAKKVRRNLFMGDSLDDKVEIKTSLSRRKSVAVMQTTQTWKSPRRGRGCSRSGVILKTKTVKETPGKRQVISAMLDKMERARQKQKAGSETLVQVVEESPVKPVHKTAGIRSSPRIKAASSLHGTKSFYSKTNHRHSRNLAKALNLGARIRGIEASMPPRRSRLAEHSSSIHDIQESEDSKISQESPSKFLFSEIFSPEKLQCIRKIPLLGSDSPSHNTRQKVSLTPIKQDTVPEPMLKASCVKKSLLFSPVKVQKDTLTTECLSNDVQSGLLKSPFKSPIGTPLRTPKKRKCLSQSPLATRSAEKSKQFETSSMFSENQEINIKKDDVSNKKPNIDNKMHEFQSTPPLKKIESPSNGKQSRSRISPRAKSETLDYWPRKKVRSGTPSPTAYKTPPPSAKDRICTSPSPMWIEAHKQSPTFHKVTPKSVGSSNKKFSPRSSNKRVTEKSTIFTRNNSRHQQQIVEERLQKASKSRRKLSISSQNQTSNIYCSFSSSAEEEEQEGDFLPSADQLFTEDRFHNLVGLISNQGLDSDSDPEIDFPKQQIHLNQNDQIRKENLLTPSYGLRRKRSNDSCNSNEKPSKVSRKKTPDFRNTGSSFECYQKATEPSTRLSAPEGFPNEPHNNLQIPIGEISSTSLSASFRKPSRRMTQNMPSAASGGSAVSSCANDLSCSQFSNCSSFDGDEVFTEDSSAHECRDQGYRSPRGMHTPKCKHTPLSLRGLSQLLSSPLVSPSQRKSLGGNERTRFSRRGSSLTSPK
ncbi:uncharacterized protein LOC117124971 [Anneissia japonica]|uniref:uncharacterized protein LOC117124971 n=1 Tax=Anneissia japonica TaxID=1529436 RepID=UPI0014256C5B|nr:uncharacterized protein LOC117124971 [Anneissia japonica]